MLNNDITYIFSYFTEAVPKARPITTKHHTFTPKRTKDFENFIANSTYMTMRDWNMDMFPEGIPLKISIDFFLKPPKRLMRKDGLIKGCMPVFRPDLDNYVKAVLDGLNGILFVDDSQIVKLESSKNYTESSPKIIVTISTVSKKC